MANFNKPELESSYTDFITELKDRDNDIASLFSNGSVFTGTYPVRAIRWNTTGGNNYFERRNANNNGWERLEGNSGTHKFVNLETGGLIATSATVNGDLNVTGQSQAARINVTGSTKPANGLYKPASNEIRLTTGSDDRLTIQSNGRVGVGTVIPQQKFEVQGTARIQNGSDAAFLEIGAGGSGNRFAYIDLQGDDTYTDFGLRLMRQNTGSNTVSELVHRGTGNFTINAADAADLLLMTQGTTRLVCDANGFVGVGDFTDPSHNLHIKRNDDGGNFIRLQNSEGSAYIGADADKLLLRGDSIVFGSEAGSDRAFINSNGFAIGGDNSHLVKFYIQSSGNTYSDPSNNNVAGAYIYNSNGSASGHAVLALRSNTAGGGDPFISLDIQGVAGWHVGVDNSDGDKFKIGRSWNSVGANNALSIDSSYNAVFSASVTASSFSGNGSGLTAVNATSVDGIDSGSFLRSDANDTASGVINFSGRKIGLGTTPQPTGTNDFGGRNAALCLGDGDTGIAQNGDGELELWANNVEVVNITQHKVTMYKSVVPSGSHSLGSSSEPWANLYINDLNMSNKGKQNDVDGTWGDYTIQEGHEDLFLVNHRTGKKFKFALIPVA